MENKEKKFTVSTSPHFRSKDSTTGIMLNVIIALLPALIASVFIFGFRSLTVTAVAVASCVFFEYISRKIMKRENTISDLSAVVTGMLLAFNLPASMPLWMVVIGSAVAIIVVKQFFGGIGQNFVNPALVGRIVLMASFPTAISSWASPSKADAVTSATPLVPLSKMFTDGNISNDILANTDNLPSLLDMFIGQRQGCLGEVCAVALIIGGIYLVVRKIISPVIPLVYVGTVALIMLIAGKGNLQFVAYEILGGGLLLGAIFMATDYTTSPVTFKGKIIFALGCGIITSLIRLFGSLPEGVSFSIVIMNILVPHIENLTAPKPFGFKKEKKEKDAV